MYVYAHIYAYKIQAYIYIYIYTYIYTYIQKIYGNTFLYAVAAQEDNFEASLEQQISHTFSVHISLRSCSPFRQF